MTVHRHNNGDQKHSRTYLVLISQNIDTVNYRFITLSSSVFVNGTVTFGHIHFVHNQSTGSMRRRL